MTETTTYTIRHQPWKLTKSPALTSWTIQEEPSDRVCWTPRAQPLKRPPRLAKTPCRELVSANQSLPAIHLHSNKCRCTSQTQTITCNPHHLEDAVLTEKIAALTHTLLSGTPNPTPSRTTTRPQKLKPTSRTSRGGKTRAGTHSTTASSMLSTLTRLFSPPPSPPQPSLPLQADLCIGCANLDIDKVARYLIDDDSRLSAATGHVNVNAPNHRGVTPLMAVVRSPAGRVWPRAQGEMVRFLVEGCGAEVGEEVLGMACRMGLVEVVRVLVGMDGVEVDERVVGEGGQTALHVAVQADRAEVLEVLVREGGADVDAVFDAAEGEEREKGVRGRNRGRGSHRQDGTRKKLKNPVAALHLASGSYACTRVLLECGAAVNVRDGFGRTPLHRAAGSGNADVVRLLLGAGADITMEADDGTAPLAAAMGTLEAGNGVQGHGEVVRLLLRKGADSSLGRREKGDLRGRVLDMAEERNEMLV